MLPLTLSVSGAEAPTRLRSSAVTIKSENTSSIASATETLRRCEMQVLALPCENSARGVGVGVV